MAELYELPDGWEWKEFSKVFNTPTSKPYQIQKTEYLENGLLPIIDQGKEFIIGYTNSIEKKYSNESNCIIFGDHTRQIKYVDFDFVIGADGTKILKEKDKNKYDLKFLYFQFLSKKIESLGYSRHFKLVKEMFFAIPSLDEQKRIVAKLDNLFAKIDKAIALHQKNINEANVFMTSVLNDVFVELEEKYGLDNIGNMIDILTDYHSNGAYKNLKENVELLDKEDYALMIRATDLENEDYTNNVKYITESAYNFMSKSKVFGGEIILPKIGTIGNVYFMPYLEKPVSLAMNLFMLRCSDKVMNKYMFLFLKSPRGNEDILNKANGAVTKTITKDAVRSIELPFPPFKVQQKVVSYLDDISQKMQIIKQIQKDKMQNLKALKASILDQAFKGEL